MDGNWSIAAVVRPRKMVEPDASAERWGLTDALAGLVASIVFATLVGFIVITARGDYTGKWSEHGAAAGRIAAQAAGDGRFSAPQLTPLWLITILQVPLWAGLLG